MAPYSAEAWAYGGIARLAGTLTRGLARRGHDVTLCTTDVCDASSRLRGPSASGRLFEAFRPWPAVTTNDRVNWRVFPNLSNRLAYHEQAFLPLGFDRFMRRHAGSFDVAHLHACRNLPGAIAAHHLRRARVPYVLAPNDTAPPIERRFVAKRVFDLAVGTRMLQRAERVQAVSNTEQRQLCELGLDPGSIRLIPNGVDLDDFSPAMSPGRFRRRFGLGSSPLVLFLGKLTPRKRVDVLLRAFARLNRPEARLVVAGNDMGAGRGIRRLARALRIQPRTLFTGLLRGRDRLEALADADVVVYPSQQEIFGLVPLEALLCGTPVVVADDSGCGEIVRAVEGGPVVALGDCEALAHAIDSVLTSPASWRAAAAEAGRHVRSRYGADVVCAQLEHMYHDIAR